MTPKDMQNLGDRRCERDPHEWHGWYMTAEICERLDRVIELLEWQEREREDREAMKMITELKAKVEGVEHA